MAPENQSTTDLFYFDRIHPTCLGQQAIADLLDALTWQGVQAVAADAAAAGASAASTAVGDAAAITAAAAAAGGAGSSAARASRGGALPPPMTPGPAQNLPSKCWIADRFKQVVTATGGDFAYTPARPEAPSFVLQKWAWTGTTPGSWVELTLDLERDGREGEGGEAFKPGFAGNSSGSGGRGHSGNSSAAWGWVLLLGHMRSYEGFGKARADCRGGCACKPSKFNCIWEKRETLQYNHIVKVRPSCREREIVWGRCACAQVLAEYA